MAEGENPGFTAEETAAWAEMSGQPVPAPQAPAEAEDEDLELDDEAEVEEAPAAKQEPERPRTVPHKALHAEREKRKAIEAEAQKLREFKAVMEDRFATMQRLAAQQAEQAQAPQVEEDPEPDPNQDLFAHAAWVARQVKAEREARMQAQQQYQQQQELAAAEQQVWGRWDQDRAEYVAQNEAFPDAAKFLAGLRDRQLEAYGIEDRRQRDQMINRELRDVVVQAARGGRNSADVIYRLAIAAGFNPESAKSAAAQVAQVAPPAPDKLGQITKAKDASISLSQAGGKSAPAETSLEDIASMPQDEFNRWMAKPANERLFKKLMGG